MRAEESRRGTEERGVEAAGVMRNPLLWAVILKRRPLMMTGGTAALCLMDRTVFMTTYIFTFNSFTLRYNETITGYRCGHTHTHIHIYFYINIYNFRIKPVWEHSHNVTLSETGYIPPLSPLVATMREINDGPKVLFTSKQRTPNQLRPVCPLHLCTHCTTHTYTTHTPTAPKAYNQDTAVVYFIMWSTKWF